MCNRDATGIDFYRVADKIHQDHGAHSSSGCQHGELREARHIKRNIQYVDGWERDQELSMAYLIE